MKTTTGSQKCSSNAVKINKTGEHYSASPHEGVRGGSRGGNRGTKAGSWHTADVDGLHGCLKCL